MDFEDFEVQCKTVLEKIKDIDDFSEAYCEDARTMFNYWLEIGGRELIHKWVNDRGGYITENKVEECMIYMFVSFVGWLESF